MESFAKDRGEPEPVRLSAQQILRPVQDHAMFLLDRNGRITSWNEGVEAVFGYRQDEWLGQPLRAAFTLEDRDAGVPEQELRQALATGKADDDRWLLRRSGERFFASGTLTRIADESGAHLGFLKVVRDASEPLAALDERNRLLESERSARIEAERQTAALTAAIEAIPDGVYIGDVDGIRRSNRPGLEMVGAASLEELNASPSEFARSFRVRRERDGDELAPEELPYMRALRGETAVVETWATKRSTGEDVFIRGTAAPIVVDGKIVGVVAVNSDLTGRLQLEQKQSQLSRVETVLRERDQQLRAVFSGVRDYAIFTVDVEGKISSWHEGAALMKGYTAEEAIGMPFANLFTQEDRDAGRPEQEMEVAARTGEYKGDGKRIRANGAFFDAAVVLTALRGPKDELLGYLKLTQDISDRRRQEQQREEMLKNAEAARAEAERTSHAMGEFLATISHELRTPLSAILGWANVLDRQTADPSTLRHGLAAITRNARIQVQLIEDLLDMNRIESGQLRLDVQPVEPAAVIAKAIDAVLPAATAKGIALRTLLDPRAGVISADADRLQQIVWNLLTNAVKFTPRGGRVTVATAASGDEVEISVADSGQGISPEFLSRMFDRFQQQDASTTRRHGGLGIGLSIARQLAELHGGRIRAESGGPDRGSTFTVTLPVSTRRSEERRPVRAPGAAAEAETDTGREVEQSRLDGITVLVIDDEADAREVAAYALRSAGAAVLTASSAAEGFELLRSHRPAAVICDIGMPVNDGYDFVRWLRGLSREEGGLTPAAAFTAFARAEDRERAIALGYHMHLTKPAAAGALVKAAASLAQVAR